MSHRARNAFFWKLGTTLAALFIVFIFRNAFASIINAPSEVAKLAIRTTAIEEKITGFRELLISRFDNVDQNQKNLTYRVDKVYELLNAEGRYARKN